MTPPDPTTTGAVPAAGHRPALAAFSAFAAAWVFLLVALGACFTWLYYRMYILGPEYLLPPGWRNPRH